MSGSAQNNSNAGISQRVTLAVRSLLNKTAGKEPIVLQEKVKEKAPYDRAKAQALITQLEMELDGPSKYSIAQIISENHKDTATLLKEFFSKDGNKNLSFFDKVKGLVRSAKVDLGIERHPERAAYETELRFKNDFGNAKERMKVLMHKALRIFDPGKANQDECCIEKIRKEDFIGKCKLKSAELVKKMGEFLEKDLMLDLFIVFYEELKAANELPPKENNIIQMPRKIA